MICPACNTEITYRLGKQVKAGQRFVCIICGREFAFEEFKKRSLNLPVMEEGD